jgi:putative membrane protein insertion efficiency factor
MIHASSINRLKALPISSVLVLIRGYQLLISPIMGPRCCFYPCCSNYALEAVKLHGCGKGLLLAGKRIIRCHPYSSGGHDPVPALTSSRQK